MLACVMSMFDRSVSKSRVLAYKILVCSSYEPSEHQSTVTPVDIDVVRVPCCLTTARPGLSMA